MGAHAWFSLPRPANGSDPYITGFMDMVAGTLAPGLHAYVEYGIRGPGWISTHLPQALLPIEAIARASWAAAGRPAANLHVVAGISSGT